MTTTAPTMIIADPDLASDGVEYFAMRLYPSAGMVSAHAMTGGGSRRAFATREEAQAVVDEARARNPYASQIANGERMLAEATNALDRAEIEQTLATLRGIDYAVCSRTVSAVLPA